MEWIPIKKKIYVYTVKSYLSFKVLFYNIFCLGINKFPLVKRKIFLNVFLFCFRHRENNKERKAKWREKLKKDEKAYREYLLKDWMRKKLRWLKDKKKAKPEKDAFKAAERVKVHK